MIDNILRKFGLVRIAALEPCIRKLESAEQDLTVCNPSKHIQKSALVNVRQALYSLMDAVEGKCHVY
jgi:hypothetical protein